MLKFKITKEHAGERLDIFLHVKYFDFSRSWLQKLIKKGRALVNNKPTEPARKLKPGDVIDFELELPPEISLEPGEPPGEKVKIVFENNDFIVVNKPAGLSAHPSSSEPKGTLVNWLIAHHPPIKSVGDNLTAGNIRPGLVHRLDKDTSGLMIAAKNQKTFLWLKKQFQTHQISKKYIGLTNGDPAPGRDSGQVDLNIVRSRSDPTKNTVSRAKNVGRAALTYFNITKRYADHTLIEARPVTGRTHQIRVHMKHLGTPIAGDKKYGSPSKDPKHLGRMFLHAEYISFEAPSGEKFSFNAPLPQELEECLKNIPYVVR